MATVLKNILPFTGLAVGVPASKPHLLNVNGVAVKPNLGGANADGFLVTADTINVTVTRTVDAASGNVNVYVEHWHTIEDVEPPGGLAPFFPFFFGGSATNGGIVVQDEGVDIPNNPHNTLNFVGPGVTATDVAGVATVAIPGGISGVVVEDEGVPVVTTATLNFVGPGVTATDVAGVGTVTVVGQVTVQDEGVGIANNPHPTLNFIGPDVTAADAGGGVASITIPGAAKKTLTVANAGYVILSSDNYLFVDTSGGAFAITLPDPTTFSYAKSYRLIDTKGTFGTNNLTLQPHGAEKISGLAASKIFSAPWGGWTVATDGTDWYVF